jgi:hypothetical protein
MADIMQQELADEVREICAEAIASGHCYGK